MGFEVWNVPLRRRFVADRLSCGCCLSLIYWIIILVTPFFLAYTSESFWLKTSTYRESPQADFAYKALLEASALDSNQLPQVLSFATASEIRAYPISKNVRPMQLRTYKVDGNNDGAPEVVNVEIDLPLKTGENVYGLAGIVLFQVNFDDRAKVLVEGAVHFDYNSAMPGAQFYVDGDFTLVQKRALYLNGGGVSEPYKYDTLLSNTTYAPHSAFDVALPTLIDRYRSRNLTMRLENVMTSWKPSVGNLNGGAAASAGSPGAFHAHLRIRVPEQTVIYVPTVSEMLKFAWMQYLSLGFLVWYLATYTIDFVFSFQVVESTSRLDTHYYGPKIHRF